MSKSIEWQDDDVVTTNFKTIKLSAQQNYDMGWQEAIDMVINVVGEMYNKYDQITLEELRQRIV